MAVIGVWKLKSVNQIFESGGEAIWDRVTHEFASSQELLFCQVWSAVKDRIDHLVKDLIGPTGSEESGLTESDQQIA